MKSAEGYSQNQLHSTLGLGHSSHKQVTAGLDSHLRHQGRLGHGSDPEALHLSRPEAQCSSSFPMMVASLAVPSSELRDIGLKSIPGAQTQT